MAQKLILIRGLLGSGKSTFAKKIKEGYFNVPIGDDYFEHFEDDMFFTNTKGEYKFDPSKLKDAHAWCFDKTRGHLLFKDSVIVSNTFIKYWEMKPYLEYAFNNSIETHIYEMKSQYGSIHNVPTATMERMQRDFEAIKFQSPIYRMEAIW